MCRKDTVGERLLPRVAEARHKRGDMEPVQGELMLGEVQVHRLRLEWRHPHVHVPGRDLAARN